jgi:hypothetical protein
MGNGEHRAASAKLRKDEEIAAAAIREIRRIKSAPPIPVIQESEVSENKTGVPEENIDIKPIEKPSSESVPPERIPPVPEIEQPAKTETVVPTTPLKEPAIEVPTLPEISASAPTGGEGVERARVVQPTVPIGTIGSVSEEKIVAKSSEAISKTGPTIGNINKLGGLEEVIDEAINNPNQ